MTTTTAPTTTHEPRPVPPGVTYAGALAGDERRIGRGILAIVLVVAGMFGAILALSWAGGLIDDLVLPGSTTDAGRPLTPFAYAGSLIAVGLLIPWSMFLQRTLYGVRGATLHSVVSRFRFDVMGKAFLLIGAPSVLAFALIEIAVPRGTADWLRTDTIWLLAITLVLVPLQATGEEYGFRGLVFRIAASWGRGRRTSLILGAAVPAVAFSFVHTAGDPWWNVLYVVFSVSMSYVTVRTGGIEIAAVVHSLINVVSFLFWIGLGADLTERFDRTFGAVNAPLFVLMAVILVGTAVAVAIRERGVPSPRTPSPVSDRI